jgi:phosphinothricin acetyltransferase
MEPIIRLATEADAGQVLEIYAPFCRDTPVSFEMEPPSLDEMRRRMTAVLPSYPWLVCEEDGLVLGYAYASKHRERAAYIWSVDVSAYVRDGRRRGGLGRALYTSLFAILKLQGYYSALAGITLPNPGSEGLHRALGFQLVGVYRNIGYKCGVWHDVAWSRLALREPEPEPRPPLNLESVQGSREWDDALNAGAASLRAAPPRNPGPARAGDHPAP